MDSLGGIFTTALRNTGVADAEIVDYGDRDAFLSLWDTDDNGAPAFLATMDGKSAAIIVWDGRVREGAEPKADFLTPHITPLDWALAFSIKTLSCKDAATKANFRIHIVDLTGECHEKSWAMGMRHQLLAEMPWVSLHAPLIPTRGGQRAHYRHGYRPILDEGGLLSNGSGSWVLNPGLVFAEGVRLGWGRKLVDVGRQWAALLVQSHDHHDLNNVVGPWLIASIVPKASTPSLKAFWTRLDWVGFTCQGAEDRDTQAVKEDLDVLAIDDELAAGWSHVLVGKLFGWEASASSPSRISLLGHLGNGRLFGSADPAVLLSHLGLEEGQEPKTEKYKSRVFDSPIGDGDQKRPWLLVLDLRLFSGKQTKERDWFAKLLNIAQEVCRVSPDDLAWVRFDDEELKAVGTWLNDAASAGDQAAYDTALSLFPRLCALRWPSVPIVLFSGTGRRSVTDKLAEYGNILLAPAKPNVLATNAAEQVELFLTGWRREFDAALPLVDVQRKLIALQAYKVEPSPCKQHLHRHLTIAFDESGDFTTNDYSAVGGAIIESIGQNKLDAQEKTFSFLEALRENGVNFYDHVPAYTDIHRQGKFFKACITKDTNISAHVRDTRVLYSDCKIGAFRCRLSKKQYSSGSSDVDAAFLVTLTTLLELIMAEYLPSLDYDLDSTSLSIWLPSRAIPGSKADAIRLDINSMEGMLQTLHGHSVAYAILNLAMRSRQGRSKIFEIITLKLRKIPYYKDSYYKSAIDWYCSKCDGFTIRKGSRPRLNKSGEEQLFDCKQDIYCDSHPTQFLAADYSVAAHLADACLTNDNQFPGAELGGENVNADLSFDVWSGPILEDFLRTGRLFDLDLPVEGLKVACKHDFFVGGLSNGFGDARFEKHLVARIADYTTRMHGDAFIDLATLLAGGSHQEEASGSSKDLAVEMDRRRRCAGGLP